MSLDVRRDLYDVWRFDLYGDYGPEDRAPVVFGIRENSEETLSVVSKNQFVVVRDANGLEIGRLRAEPGAKVSIE